MSGYSYLFKFIIIGDSSVGKSCILLQFLDRKFKLDHDTTIGVEFGSKTLTVKEKNIKLQIWDTVKVFQNNKAGQESFKSITRSYYRGSICGLIVYDITQKDSFLNIARWLEETRHYANEKISLVLIGNKSDLGEKREVTYEEGEAFAKRNDLLFFETSAKTGFNIEQAFNSATEMVLRKIETKQIDASNESIGIRVGTQLTEEMVLAASNKKQQPKQCCM